jgi:uncharacterized membrane protein YcaP (DUF421 family)
MRADLIHFDLPPSDLLIRAVVVFGAVLLLLRVSGKRQLGQMGATEFVALLLISNAVQNAMNGGDNSLPGGLLLAAALIAMSTLISVLTFRSRFFERVIEGSPRLLIHDGKLIERALTKERLSHTDLKGLLRKQGVHRFDEVKNGILEADGTLSIVRYADVAKGDIKTS